MCALEAIERSWLISELSYTRSDGRDKAVPITSVERSRKMKPIFHQTRDDWITHDKNKETDSEKKPRADLTNNIFAAKRFFIIIIIRRVTYYRFFWGVSSILKPYFKRKKKRQI